MILTIFMIFMILRYDIIVKLSIRGQPKIIKCKPFAGHHEVGLDFGLAERN